MKYVIAAGILLGGIGIGYIIGAQNSDAVPEDPILNTEFITQTVVDTFIQKETVQIPIAEAELDSSKLIPDSLLSVIDTTNLGQPTDSLNEDISISREKLIDKIWLNVNVIAEVEESDSLIKDLLGIEDKLPTKVLVEFWESPLSFTGYKLSRSKLVLYGMSPHIEYRLFRKKTNYFLSVRSFYYSLRETEVFLPYLEVSKELVFND